MSNSTWLFGCKLTLWQGNCQRHESDHESRGFARLQEGCASCKHRKAGNRPTAEAEAYQRQLATSGRQPGTIKEAT